jgi:hypothetical protein
VGGVQTAVRTLMPFERRFLSDPTAPVVVRPFIDRTLQLLLKASPYWRQFGHYFAFLKDFALLGPQERALLLDR